MIGIQIIFYLAVEISGKSLGTDPVYDSINFAIVRTLCGPADPGDIRRRI